MIGFHADQRQQGRREVDLARDDVPAFGLDPAADDHRRHVETLHRDDFRAVHTRIVIGNDQEYGVVPVARAARRAEKTPERVVGVLHRIVHGLFLGVVELDAAVRELERRVIR